MIINFREYILEEKTDSLELTEDDISFIVDNLDWSDIYDLYSNDELIEDSDNLDESLSAQMRLKKGQIARRAKNKLTLSRRLKLRRPSTLATLKNRARIAARRLIIKQLLRNRTKKFLSAQEKSRIEARVSAMGPLVTSLSSRLVPKMREIERNRLARQRSKLIKRK